jgi:ATP-dependent Zn protease
MIIGFGGRIAEYMVFGKQQVTTGAANDLKVIASIAKNMVEVYGFSDKYTWIKNDEQTGRSNEYLALADIDEVDLINDAERIAKSMLVEHKDKLDKLANRLLEKETITGYEVKEICGLEH